MKKLAFALLGLIALSSSAMAGQTTKPPVLDAIDYDRFQYDGCYMSNCGNVPTTSSAQAQVVRSPDSTFATLDPTYAPGVSCTSLLSLGDNLWQTVLQSSQPFSVLSSGRLDLTLNSEPRVQRRNAISDTGSAGVGAIAVRAFVLPVGQSPNDLPAPLPIFERWILHENVDNTLRTQGSLNPDGTSQPIISTSSIRRLLNLAPSTGYNIFIQAKWSVVRTSLQLEPSTVVFVADSGGRGALICVPQVTLETWNQ